MFQEKKRSGLQEIGAPVDDFALEAIQGERTALGAFLKGKRGSLVLFWSGICSHCVRYDRYLNTFEECHPEIALAVIASRQNETMPMIMATISERKLTFPILHDPDGRIAARWSTQQTPRAFLIDADLRLLYRGAIDNYKYPEDSEHASYLEPAIAQFLAGEKIVRAETASFGCAIQSVYYILPKAL